MIVRESEGKAFTPCPEGLHLAVCCDVVDLGMVETQWGAKSKVRLVWQVDRIIPDSEPARKFTVIKQYNATLGSVDRPSNLRKDLQNWRGRSFTQQEVLGFELDDLVGKVCQIQVLHNKADNGKTYDNVTAVLPAPEGVRLGITDYVRVKDREKDEHEEPAGDDDLPF